MYVCTLWKGVPYHLWAKNVASGGPPPTSFRSPKNMWGGGIFHVVRWNISQKFLALPPSKYSRVKGGGIQFPLQFSIFSPRCCQFFMLFPRFFRQFSRGFRPSASKRCSLRRCPGIGSLRQAPSRASPSSCACNAAGHSETSGSSALEGRCENPWGKTMGKMTETIGKMGQWPFQDPKLEVPTIYKAYFSGLCKWIPQQNMALYGTVPPF